MHQLKNIIGLFFILCNCFTNAQNNTYNQKKEYGFKGAVKKVTTYMVRTTKYRIPTDTVDYFGKSTMNFTKNGNLTTYNRFYNMPDYAFKSNMHYKGSGKNISFTETSSLNGEQEKKLDYTYHWTTDLSYEILPKLVADSTKTTVHLNTDFSIKKVVFEGVNFKSEEEATYLYDENNQLQQLVYHVKTTDGDEISTIQDVRKIKSVDVFNNPTVIYFYETTESRVPKSVLFRYYEYY